MKKQRSKGITLIALVITIIVMLILVAVTINVATDGGLISKAKEANEKTKIELEKESKLNDEMADKIDEIVSGKAKYQDEISNLPEGETSVAQEDLSGDLKEAAADGKIVAVIKEGEDLAPIPQGFTISEVAEEQRISTGLVVKDKSGNEFVWVPVKDVIYNGTTAIEGTYKPMVKLQSGSTTDYEGVLYDFDDEGEETLLAYEMYNYGVETQKNREPSVLDEGAIGDESKGITEELMQSTFNNMVESVSKYGGFYVGRYETTNMDSSKITVKAGTQTGITHQNWYTMYEKAKTLTTNYVQTEMIWGCQYDTMINWMLTGTQASKLGQETNGNHSNEIVDTGTTSTDIINNIYDLEGNMFERTQEADHTSQRIHRGGFYGLEHPVVDRYEISPKTCNDILGMRITLYIK